MNNPWTRNRRKKLPLVLAFSLLAGSLLAAAPSDWGSFPKRPLQLSDLVPPDGRRFSLIREFDYIDPNNIPWVAPQGLITDGASIPMPFWSVIGGPFEGLYREAAVVHDAGCCAKTARWQDVHQMFYNAMRCSGVGLIKAKVMYYAVWVGGPRWTTPNQTMPPECTVSNPFKPGFLSRFVTKLPPPELVLRVWEVLKKRALTVAETRAVARPFFPSGAMSADDAAHFVAALKKLNVTPVDKELITFSVIQGEMTGDEDVGSIERWIEQDDPSLAAIEARADQMRGRKVSELRLFPEIRELLEWVPIFQTSG